MNVGVFNNPDSNIQAQCFLDDDKNIYQFTVSSNSLKELKELIQKIMNIFEKNLDFNQEIDEYLHYRRKL